MESKLSEAYSELLDGTYDSVDRIVINGYFRGGHIAGGFRNWWRRLHGNDEKLDNEHLMRMAGRLSRRLRSYCEKVGIPVIECERGERKDVIAAKHKPRDGDEHGLFLVLVGRASAATWNVEKTKDGRIKNLSRKYPYVKHYYFHIMDPEWGHVTVRMSGHPPFGVQVILNGHEYINRQAQKRGYNFNQVGNSFTDIIGTLNDRQSAETVCSENIVGPPSDVELGPNLAQIAETVCSEGIVGQLRQVCDRWLYSTCLRFALNAQEQEQSCFKYSYSLFQLEFSHNLLFHRGRQLDSCFQGIIDRTRSRLDIKRLKTIFGAQRRLYAHKGNKPPREEVVVERPSHDLTVFKVHFGYFTLKLYSKGERLLRAEAIVHNTKAVRGKRQLDTFPEWVDRLKQMVQRFLDQLQGLDACFVADDCLDSLPQPGALGARRTAGIDLNKPRIRAVLEAVLSLSLLPNGFSASDIAAKVREILNFSEHEYLPRHAAYDLRKLRGKLWVERVGKSRRYRTSSSGLQTISALLRLREDVIKPVLAGSTNPIADASRNELSALDSLYAQIQALFRQLLGELGFAL